MWGLSARTVQASSAAGRAGSRRRSLGLDLLGVGRLASSCSVKLELALALAGRAPAPAAPPAQLRQLRGRASSKYSLRARSGPASCSATGPASSPAVTPMIVAPVRSSPAMIARSIGAAPRQRGISEGCTFSIRARSAAARAISWPKAQTATTSGSTAAAPRRTPARSRSLSGAAPGPARARPRRRAAATACGRGRGGGRAGVTTSAGRCSLAASARRTVAANSEVPR